MSSCAESKLYQVSGLWCSSCAKALQHSINRLDGIAECSVDFVTHTLQLRLEREGAFSDMERLLEGMGYRLKPYQSFASLRSELAERTRGEFMRLAWVAFFAVWTMALALVEYTEAMGPLSGREYRGLALAMGALSVTGIFVGGAKVYRIGMMGLLRLRPSIDSLLLVTSLACLGLSFYNLNQGVREVYFDSAIIAITVVLAIRAVLAMVSGRQLDFIYQSLLQDEPELLVVEDGEEVRKPVASVKPGYRVRVSAGEAIAVDGTVLEGAGTVQTAFFTGEADPVRVRAGTVVRSGEVLVSGEIDVQVESYFGEREVDRLTQQVLRSFHKNTSHRMVDTILANAAPGLIGLAVVVFVGLVWGAGQPVDEALPAALSVMIVACPCALFFCRPLPLLRAQMLASREGALLMRAEALEALNSIRTVAFDKTGTLTGRASCLRLLKNATAFSEAKLWAILAGAESRLQHPIAYAVMDRAAAFAVVPESASAVRQLPRGVTFGCLGKDWVFGQADQGSDADLCLWVEGEAVAEFKALPADRKDVPDLIRFLQEDFALALLSGDRDSKVKQWGRCFNIVHSYGGLSSADKSARLGELRKEYGAVLYCGDGYNDVEAFGAADVSVAMAHAPATLRLASDIILLRCDRTVFRSLFARAQLARRRFRQNLVFAVSYNLIAIPAAIAGAFAPWLAAAAMGAATLAVVLNSLR